MDELAARFFTRQTAWGLGWYVTGGLIAALLLALWAWNFWGDSDAADAFPFFLALALVCLLLPATRSVGVSARIVVALVGVAFAAVGLLAWPLAIAGPYFVGFALWGFRHGR